MVIKLELLLLLNLGSGSGVMRCNQCTQITDYLCFFSSSKFGAMQVRERTDEHFEPRHLVVLNILRENEDISQTYYCLNLPPCRSVFKMCVFTI